MLKSIIKASSYITGLVFSGLVGATGLGGINVSSYLGQPLKAEVELVSLEKADRASVSARLASPESFKAAGVDYPYALPRLKFEAVNLNSSPAIRISSSQPVNEPFVTLLIEVTWSSGKLLREYTFLLDPADFKVPEAQPAPVSVIAPAVVVPAAPVRESFESSPATAQQALVSEQQPQSAPEETTSTPASEMTHDAATKNEPTNDAAGVKENIDEAPLPVKSSSKLKASSKLPEKKKEAQQIAALLESVKVVKGDSLSKIAAKTKPAEVSLERMLVAMYRANPDAFDSDNMNRLKTGKIIKVPVSTELEAVQQSEAEQEISAQVADWNAYRQQLSAIPTVSAQKSERQSVSGKVKSAVKDGAAAAKEDAKDVLKLSKGEAPNDKAVGASKPTSQEKSNAKEEEAVAKAKALKEAEERNALLEKNVKDLQRLAELKNSISTPAESAAVVSSPVVESAPESSVVKAPVHAPEPAVTQSVEPQVEDDLLSDPLTLAGGLVALLALGGAGVYFARRKKGGKKSFADNEEVNGKASSEKTFDGEIGNATGRIASPVVPSPETGDFTQMASFTQTALAPTGGDEIDPIGEADLFLTFGRDAQAEEVLKEALRINPSNTQVRLKLLSIYANRSDSDEFFTHANIIKDSGDKVAWDKAAELGRAIDPTNPLYGGTDDVTSVVETAQKMEVSAPSVDFDLGFGGATNQDSDFLGTVVLDTPVNEITAILTADELRPAQDEVMDFDVTGTHPGGSPAATAIQEDVNDDLIFDVTSSQANVAKSPPLQSDSSSLDDLVFDITANHNGLSSTESVSPAKQEDNLSDHFSLDFPEALQTQAAVKSELASDMGLADISLSMDGLKLPSTTESVVKDERWQEVATKLDLAKAYQEMGDDAGAKEILEEVLRDGDEQQRASANAMLQNI
ncbi:MAG: hypothetical protein PHP57_07840 [Sideroxydans sp.]|nr:hypothetical protein [Sideroxydans sp.]